MKLISADTNILLYALHEGIEEYRRARKVLENWAVSTEFVIGELVLAELYQFLRNPVVFGRSMSSKEAAGVIQRFRKNPKWLVAENAPVMSEVWKKAAEKDFARRRLFDVRLALTLQHHGVTHFATANVKDFEGLGFEKVWNPLEYEVAR